MLAILQFDAASVAVLDRLLAEGRLPTLAAFRHGGCGTTSTRPPPQFAAGAQHTLYSGIELADHGLFYPFQWSPPTSGSATWTTFHAPAAGVGAAAPTGRARSRSTRTRAGRRRSRRRARWCAAGSSTTASCSQQWSSPPGAHRAARAPLRRARNRSTRCSAATTVERDARPPPAPARRARTGRRRGDALLGEEPYDLAWLTFCAAHVAGHQFWDLSQLDPAEPRRRRRTPARQHARRRLPRARRGPRRASLAALPRAPTSMLVSPVGMDVNTSRADLLPEMLRAILDPRTTRPTRPPSGSIWRLRAALPSGLRATVGRALPETVALDLTARLELRGYDWSRDPGVRPPGREPGLRPAQPAGPRARRDRRPPEDAAR